MARLYKSGLELCVVLAPSMGRKHDLLKSIHLSTSKLSGFDAGQSAWLIQGGVASRLRCNALRDCESIACCGPGEINLLAKVRARTDMRAITLR